MHYDFDVIIAGGGPAGSSTANLLRQKGRSVLVLERDRFPRFHVGESLLPYSNDLWRELGVFDWLEQHCQRKPGACFVHEETGAKFTYYFDSAIRVGDPYAFNVKRADFDQALLDRAVELGADVRQRTRVLDVSFQPDGVLVDIEGPDGERYRKSAPMFIDATGRDAFLAGKQQLKVADEIITTNVSLNCAFTGAARESGLEEGNIIIGLFDGGWYWVIPFADGDMSIGFVLEKRYTKVNRGLSRKEMYAQVLATTPYLQHLLRDAKPTIEVFGEGNWSYRARRFYGDRWLLVGDSSAFVDPLFSSGILIAGNQAKLAVEHIERAFADGDFSADRFATYETGCTAGMDLFKSLVLEFYAENLRNILVASSINPGVCSAIVSMLAGDVMRPAVWHGLVKNRGFSNQSPSRVLKGQAFTTSREVMAAAAKAS